MSRKGNDDAVLALIVIAVLAVLAVVWKFSTVLGLDMATGAKVLLSVALATGLYIACLKFELIELRKTWQLYLGAVWFSFWPALDHWAVQSASPFSSEESVAWFGAWYTKVGVLVFIVGGGYLLNKMRDD
jgi:hypothetical protein